MEQDYKYMVSTKCYTYNHAATIEDTLEGFAMQKVCSPIVYIVVDDASVDGTPTIIRKWAETNLDFPILEGDGWGKTSYGDLLVASLKKNKDLLFVLLLLFENHRQAKKTKRPYIENWLNVAKYQAICEGDDYWIDSRKLQKQIDFLEENDDYSMCYHNAVRWDIQKKQITLFSPHYEDGDLSISDAINNWYVPTASIVFRSSYLHYPNQLKRIYSGDYSLILRCAYGGKIRFFKEFMSVYRYNNVGSSSSAKMKKNGAFVKSEHIKLLESYNEWTNYKYNQIISNKIKSLKQEQKYYSIKNKSHILCLFTIYFYKKIFDRGSRLIKYL